MKITTLQLALIALTISIIVLIVLGWWGIHVVQTVEKHFSEIFSPLVALSVSLIIFPIITIPYIGNIVLNAKRLNIQVRRELVKDYIDGCYTVFALAVSELLAILAKPLITDYMVYLIVSLLIALVITLVALMLSLWKVTKLLYEVL